jgi:hypothetical protein
MVRASSVPVSPDREFIFRYLHEDGVVERFAEQLISIAATESDWKTASDLTVLLRKDQAQQSKKHGKN